MCMHSYSTVCVVLFVSIRRCACPCLDFNGACLYFYPYLHVSSFWCLFFVTENCLCLGVFVLCLTPQQEHRSASLSGAVWDRVLALCPHLLPPQHLLCLPLSVSLPSGQQRSQQVQLVRLCLDRLTQTYSSMYTHSHTCTSVITQTEAQQQKSISR